MQTDDGAARASIDVELEVDAALGLVEGRFAKAKTSTTRICDGGWTVDRVGRRLMIYPTKLGDILLEPLPKVYLARLPETLALRVDAASLGRGTRVAMRFVRRRIGATVGAVALDLATIFGAGIPLFYTVVHTLELRKLRPNRVAARRRVLRLAVEPLVPHELGSARGPFRDRGSE